MNRGTVGVNSLPKTVIRQCRGCDLNPCPSAPESSTLTTQLPMSAGQMSNHTWCLGIRRVCGDTVVCCPPRQLNGGYIETAVHSNLIGLHLPCTATSVRKARDTMRGLWPLALVLSNKFCTGPYILTNYSKIYRISFWTNHSYKRNLLKGRKRFLLHA